VRRKGLNLLTWTPELRQWQARVALLRQLDLEKDGHSEWPDLGDEALLASLEDWLQPYLGKVSRLSHFAALDLPSMLRNLLPWPLPQRLDELAPRTWPCRPARTSAWITAKAADSRRALQELFGLADTPRIANGRQQVKLHLLSPARRPVQVTQDLANFWRTTYAEVKKDLKGAIRSITGRTTLWWPRLRRGPSREGADAQHRCGRPKKSCAGHDVSVVVPFIVLHPPVKRSACLNRKVITSPSSTLSKATHSPLLCGVSVRRRPCSPAGRADGRQGLHLSAPAARFSSIR
jgi:hypothetical protein